MDLSAGLVFTAFWLIAVIAAISLLQCVNRSHAPLFMFFTIIFFAATIVLLSASSGSHPSNYVYFQLNIDQRKQECVECTPKNDKIRVIFANKVGSANKERRADSRETVELLEQERILLNASQPDFRFSNETVVNPHNFTWTILEKDVCTGSRRRPFILIVVHSAPKNLKQRMFIRETWGAADLCAHLGTLVVFALGSFPTPHSRQQQAVERENSVYRDIIQESFIDSYRNLTYKTVMWLRWATFYCPDAKYVLKLDDDIFANTFNLVKHVENMHKRNVATHNTLSCNVWNGVKVDRNISSKWFVPKSEFDLEFYPTYCSGSAYMMSSDLVPKLYYASFKVPFFWVDDFWLTGQVAAHINASWYQMRSMFSLVVKNKFIYEENFTEDYIVFGHVPHVPMKEKYRVWKRIAATHGYAV